MSTSVNGEYGPGGPIIWQRSRHASENQGTWRFAAVRRDASSGWRIAYEPTQPTLLVKLRGISRPVYTRLEGHAPVYAPKHPGMLWFVPAGARLSGEGDPNESEYCNLMVNFDLLERAAEAQGLRGPPDLVRCGLVDEGVRAHVERLRNLLLSPGPNAQLGLEAGVLDVARWIVNGMKVRPPRLKYLAPWQMRRLADLMWATLDRPLRLRELADTANVSEFHLSHAFTYTVGMPPHRFHSALRMQEAARLLRSDDRSVTQVAMSLGFDDPAYFARLFRRHHGATPTAWRSARAVAGRQYGTRSS